MSLRVKCEVVGTIARSEVARGLGQVRCRKASWGCFGGRSFQNGGRKHESSAS